MFRPTLKRPLVLAAAALSLSACVSLLPQSDDLAPRLGLDPGFDGVDAGTPLGVSLSIADPRAEAVFDTANVAVLTGPLQYEYLDNAEWTDRAPLLLGIFLERRFENSNRFTAVGDRVGLPVADYTLHTDVRALNLDVTAERRAVVAYGARLTNRRNEVLGTKVFRATAPIGGSGNEAAVLALNAAAADAADQTAAWAAPLIEADRDVVRQREDERNARRRPRTES